MNKTILIGRLTKDPELKYIPNTGTATCNFTLAVDRRFKKEGQQEADFIPIVVWGKQAESTANYMSKGKLMGVSGRIQTRSYDAKDGTRRYVTEVVAEEVKFLEWGKDSNIENVDFGVPVQEDITPVDNSDIPF
ncbi:single-strand DNA-binding protein [Clostridium acetobutylicum]|uniref:Single-stranded DNA-binding protein 2 n=1 Tax=Clostridium acetobutylicum (strain ATCC 824 / DSM 792 / JCM 1419 / IAM 19013 / LMG 5710 / NBRC 13948 / NRRL B-527 / VKM B-1787 / 2291 / W) TaxID=272562 RepID=SSB2_CLOAB|nr:MULTISPECIES: single-stranded DNA-binding protein [Clostridium]Q97HT8.1 RecName: Full=Single-stranded DNA-binding protein 2; Short=SSB 2 [Clostridium acetobutylicum ATCC 824]AAK79882.1 Phage related SSB-like protein [Clostridium acetobutylicum ATCC 824]ADZ20971.1 Phage related SSB-like protein [Clostridium acetobutylicum EA 2018]AEI34039.1 Phage related SSB-like protein [Clostridium acetobutylicum DSM 1731]AWV79687.1 single-stranded DNA-binding protein [Clostridium acetobutylicum]MBC239433